VPPAPQLAPGILRGETEPLYAGRLGARAARGPEPSRACIGARKSFAAKPSHITAGDPEPVTARFPRFALAPGIFRGETEPLEGNRLGASGACGPERCRRAAAGAGNLSRRNQRLGLRADQSAAGPLRWRQKIFRGETERPGAGDCARTRSLPVHRAGARKSFAAKADCFTASEPAFVATGSRGIFRGETGPVRSELPSAGKWVPAGARGPNRSTGRRSFSRRNRSGSRW
jgi:hypothetical protein